MKEHGLARTANRRKRRMQYLLKIKTKPETKTPVLASKFNLYYVIQYAVLIKISYRNGIAISCHNFCQQETKKINDPLILLCYLFSSVQPG